MDIFNCFVALLLIVRSAHCSKRIVGLERISKIELPGMETYQGRKFLTNFRDVCTGILMSPTEVLTSCECVLDNDDDLTIRFRRRKPESLSLIDPTELRVRTMDVGHWDADLLNISEIRIHPKCDAQGSYDLAMLRLSTPVSNSSDWFNGFPFGSDWNGRWDDGEEADEVHNKSRCYLASFLTNALVSGHPLWTKRMHNDITEIPVDVVDMEYCDRFLSLRSILPGYDLKTKICVEAEQQPVPICKADIGSPLICHDVDNIKSSRLIGMTSIGHIGCSPRIHDALAIVTPLDEESWNFIHDFMGIGYKRWIMHLLKRSFRWCGKLVQDIFIGEPIK